MSQIADKNINGQAEDKDATIERLQKELKFVKNQMASALSLYDEAKQEADRAAKTKSEFISKMSHEFRTPMNALMGYSDLLISREGDEEIRQYAAGIKSATNRLLNMANDLIEVSRIESGITFINDEEYTTTVLFNSILDGLYDAVSEKGLILKLNVQEDIPSKLYGDFHHLRQVVSNILDNAVKYTEKGYIGLDIEAKKGEELNENGRKSLQISFHVKDTGTGIRKKDQDKLFKAFSQFNSKNPYANQGVGIGLVVAKYYSNQMYGDITFESKYGEGSTFSCTVIQEIVDETPIGAKDKIGPNVHRHIVFKAPAVSVLVIDDSMVNLNVAKGLLKAYDIDADIAEGGYEALKLVDKKKYELVFMDHMMPDIDGIETMRRIRDKGGWCEKVPIVALTANVTDEARRLFKIEGMQDFLAKPIELSLLRDILIKWLPKDKIEFGDVSEAYDTDRHEEYNERNTAFTRERLAKANIELDKGLTHFGGNLEAYKATAADIYKECLGKVLLMESYLSEMNLQKYAIEAHSIKSVSASIGAMEFSKMAKEMEYKAKAGEEQYIKDNGLEFIGACHEFIGALGDILEEERSLRIILEGEGNDSGKAIDMVDEPMSDEEINKVIDEAVAALEDFEADVACQRLKRLLGQKNHVDMVQKLYVVLEKIDDFEYEEAEEILRRII